MPMDREERIEQLQRETEEHKASIAAREAARERDPIAYDDFVMREGRAGLRFRTQENTAPALPTYVEMYHDRNDPSHKFLVHNLDARAEFNQKGWDEWVKGHIKNSLTSERTEVLDQVARTVAEFTSQYIHEKMQPLRTEIDNLKRALAERDERARAIAEVKREAAGERVEREALQLSSALAARDAKIAALEERLQMLLRFLSVSGYDLQRGM